MTDISKFLIGFYQFSEGEWKRSRGLNYVRKICHLKRGSIPEISDMKPFNLEYQYYLDLKQRDIIRKRNTYLRQRENRVRNLEKRRKQKEDEEEYAIASAFVYKHNTAYWQIHDIMTGRKRIEDIFFENEEKCLKIWDKYRDQINTRTRENYKFVCNQMQSADAHGVGETSQSQANNVILASAREDSGDSMPSAKPSADYVCEDAVSTYDVMVDRWIQLCNYTWNKDHVKDHLIFKKILPHDFVKDESNTINAAPFYYHMFWNGDMEIRVVLNSNKFQAGQLQVSWYYGAEDDDSYSIRSNIFSSSQRMHGILNAGSSNEVILKIPYRHTSPMVSTKDIRKLDLGMLQCRVLSRLLYGTNGVTSTHITTYIRFTNCTFGGTIDRTVTPQMETAMTIAAAESMLRLTGLSNCDNPPNVRSANYVVPASIHPLSVGTGDVDTLYPLRLDARGQNNGNFCAYPPDHQSVLDLARTFGLYNFVLWKTSHVEGEELYTVPVAPCMEMAKYVTDESPDSSGNFESYRIPPVGVVSSLFAQWRGSLEYRFDIVSTSFHTGRLMVAFIPSCGTNTTITLAQARSSHHAIFDLQENNSFTFVVPYVARDVWCRNKRRMGVSPTSTCYFGRLGLYVVNRLCAPATVPDTIEINLYMRAGPSFEVSIPIQPTLGLAYVRMVLDTTPTEFAPTNASSDGVYVGTWNDFPNALVLRWGTLPGRIADFSTVTNLYNKAKPSIYFENPLSTLTFTDDDDKVRIARYFAIVKRAETWTAFLCRTAREAAVIWNAELAGTTVTFIKFAKAQNNNFVQNVFLGAKTFLGMSVPLLLDAQMERENANDLLNATRSLISTNCGMSQFGENFAIIKDLCRRYQYFGKYDVTPKDMRNGNGILFQFLANPCGMRVNGKFDKTNVDYVQNKCRDGIIPILLSAFRFYRGSVRFKIVVPIVDGISFWVQHRPEIVRERMYIVKPTAADDEMDMLAHGYGSHLVVGQVNGALEFEVPFYQPGIYGALGKMHGTPNDKFVYASNGLVVVGCNNASTASTSLNGLKFVIYYSLADDFEVNTFQGFPPMIDCTTINEDFPEGEFICVNNQGPMDYITKKISTVGTNVVDNSILGQKLNGMAESLTNIFKELFGSRISTERYVEFSIFMGSQIAHLVNNFNSKTMAICIISVFLYIGIKITNLYTNIVEVLEKILRIFISPPNEVLDGVEYKEAKNNSDTMATTESHFITYISAIFTALCLYFKIDKAGSLEDGMLEKLKKLFLVDISSVLRTGNGLYVFLRNHFIVVKLMMKRILSMAFPRYDAISLFKDPSCLGYKFIEEADKLCSREMSTDYRDDPMYVERVASCENTGRTVLASLLRDPEDIGSKIHLEVEKQMNRIQKINAELKQMGIYPSIRKRPFHLYMTGVPGIGKSFLTHQLAMTYMENILPAVHISPNFICKVDAGSRYWNHCTGKQPAVIFDDLWGVTAGPVFDEMLVHYLALHSNVPFMPPMAALEDKKMIYAPEFVISTSNYAFPQLPGVDLEAIYRRRNILVHVELAPPDLENHPNCDHCKKMDINYVHPSHLADNHHLQFAVYEDVKSMATVDSVPRMGYQQFVDHYLDIARKHAEKEQAVYKARIDYFEERAVLISGHTFEERMTNEKFGYSSYFEALIDREIIWKDIPIVIKKKLYGFVEAAASKFYRLDLNVDNQMPGDETPGTSKQFEESNKNFIANKELFTKYFDHSSISVADKQRFLEIKGKKTVKYAEEYMMAQCSSGGRFQRISWNGFFAYLKTKSNCTHLKRKFIESSYFDGKFSMYSVGDLHEEYRCEGWCVLNTEFADMVMELWLQNSPVKRIYHKRKITKYIPEILRRSSGLTVTNTLGYIVDEVKVMMQRFSAYLKENPLISSMYDFITNLISKIYKLLKEWCYMLVPIVAAIGMGTYASMKVNNNIVDRVVGATPQAHHYDARILRAPKPIQSTISVARAQAASQQAQVVERLFRKNAVWITVEYVDRGNIKTRKMRCVMLGVRKLLILRHYLDFYLDLYERGCKPVFFFSYVDQSLMRISGNGRIELRLLDLERTVFSYGRDSDSNLIILELPGTIPPAKDLTHFIATTTDHTYVNRYGWLIQVDSPTHRIEFKMDRMGDSFSISPGAESYDRVRMKDAYVYDYEGDGVCGSLILAPGLERPIIGIHVAGEPGVCGIAEPLVAETFGYVAKTKPYEVADLDLLPPEYGNVNITTTIFPRGSVGIPYAQHQAIGTQFVPSLIQGVFPVETSPVPLEPGDERLNGKLPLEVGVNKHGLLSDPFPRNIVAKAASDYSAKIMTFATPVLPNVGVLPIETAIIGDPLVPEFTPLCWSSSEGFPLVKERPKNVRSKKWLFDLIENADGSYGLNGISPRLRQILAHEEKLRSEGVIVPTIFTDICKDETALNENNERGKVRVFSTAPVQYVIAFRRYYGDFMAAFKRANIDVEHGIGIDVNSVAWTKLAHYLSKYGKSIVAGDYSHFGYTLNAQFVEAAFDIMIDWYAQHSASPTLEKDQLIRKCLKNEILNVHRLAQNFVYQAACGIPSGFPATDIVNSMVNCLYIRAAWLEITKESLYVFKQNVNMIVYGDDIAMNVTDKYIGKFNTESLSLYFGEYGIKFTDIDKSDRIIPSRTLDDATFLKCNFVKHPTRRGIYLAALAKTSVQGAANWVHCRDDLREATLENAKQCLELGHGHGPEYYDYLKKKLQESIREKMRVDFDYYTWHELDERRYGSD